MKARPEFPLSVFYDGSCRVCSREIDHYRNLEHGGKLIFVDISAPDFEPALYGRSRREFMVQMHVRDAGGRYFLGVDSFPAIWEALPGPGYHRLAKLIRLPGIHLLATLGYRLFARLRVYLPRRRDCGQGHCDIGHSR
ncbi:DUF393 domain-containing protein [Desulfuromonas carbonis]|uniref:thiol-disulfide oxidoreductase DCC family protein n=1 Tax=Desulfuromonas sp. DDH964 TaxID=1823759 RepID=UPI00078BAF5E|nr:DUF393 domain-containing protein [Desulfuromonas sp. DDH964]AMV73418.1 thiol-disulfide oxidoreductase [Desulfuromonas sp. DDH964]